MSTHTIRVLGYAVMAVPFMIMFTAVARTEGIRMALWSFGLVVTVVSIFALGAWMVTR